ncbi:helix-turn-helix domain-containing protein [Roseibium sediminicola]|uniref:Helix-turn-helix domain-containing protein n=1 Tax=Roseibium sediminicola TaxID=2933272 RepID=A0ABT0GRD4_9HYPH|nr:helix-turn-helix domain-containing protein [Roseibium sp. CAU 1639]MCK7611988.1 helix-turn-helix domain-containing protein [Roseibium sp. CAU 1639]
MSYSEPEQAASIDKDATIEALRDQVAYLEAQLMDQDVHFPGTWRLSPNEKRILRHLIKRPLVTRESAMAVLYHERGGNEPDLNILRVYIRSLRRALSPMGIEILTHHGEGYSICAETRESILRLCADISPNGEAMS